MLLEKLTQMYGERLDPTNFETFRTEVCWKQGPELEEKDILYFE